MRIIKADYLFDGYKISNNKIIVVNNDNFIIDILPFNPYKNYKNIEIYKGILTPGFINSHCHIELSYLKNKIKKHIGLKNFILSIKEYLNKKYFFAYKNRYIEKAHLEMIKEGIVAVADITNTLDSFKIKNQSKTIKYHTFMEIIDLIPLYIENKFKKFLNITNCRNLNISITPHSPYSVSEKMLKYIGDNSNYLSYKKKLINYNIITIHNQESNSENILFKYKKGDMIDLYQKLKYDINNIKIYNKTSIKTYLNWLKNRKILLVHNTYTSYNDMIFANNTCNVYWCFCPNANLYINNILPAKYMFNNKNILLGTDGYASNDKLSILSEMITLQYYYPFIKTEQLLKWCTINPANFFEWNDLGKLKIGLNPGINLITNITNNILLTNKSKVKIIVKKN